MIVEDEHDDNLFDQGFDFPGETIESLRPEHGLTIFTLFTQFYTHVCDWITRIQLQNDLIEHMWTHLGNQ